MSWPLLIGIVFGLGLALAATLSRRATLRRMERAVKNRERAVRQGSAKAQLQHPLVDLSRCLGCGTCVQVCPEEGVIELVHGQAVVVNGTRCVGHAVCERECPVGAITVALADVEERKDIPALTKDLEAVGAPGLFLAGEVTAHSLIKTAIDHGAAVSSEVARRVRSNGQSSNGTLDLCIVGAGPAGLACSLEATRRGLRYVTLEQAEGPGGTVARYPRRKLVVTQPVDMPLHGRLERTTYTKEQLIGLWQSIADKQQLPLRYGQTLKSLERDEAGNFVVSTGGDTFVARNVCLALGRRGSPRKLGVPGEELAKVAYGLLDAQSYRGRKILVVGGGDSAVEAAMGLAEQPGNEVTLSYRKESFFRIRAKNEERLERCLEQQSLDVIVESEVTAIRPDEVDLKIRGCERRTLPNDEVFVMAGGTAPLELLERAGVSFDPSLRESPSPIGEQGTGLVNALAAGFALSFFTLLFALWHADYYLIPGAERPAHPKHLFLRPGLALGLWFGIAAATLVCINLLYLLRRSPGIPLRLGSLKAWMTSHITTGILAFLCASLHAAMTPRGTAGGYAYWALVALVVTGAIGRYFYAWVPRAANGRELELTEVKGQLRRSFEGWESGQRDFRERVKREMTELIDGRQWRGSFLSRVLALIGVQRDLRRVLKRLETDARAESIPEERIVEAIQLARRAHRVALVAAHFEDLRAVLNSWRYLHRWVTALMVVLVALHVFNAFAFGGLR